ncbi:hypothetical protein D777_02764 [Marinobacter nitratireducens]|uniref:Uncharacterized protein n=1 Tax=Marinobacter nitratireducens TaxID=1137280 RepID=A0A072N0R9_9GAMM|nr:hypothetical protein D777_02764 [Marinobacter nitratireducens]
MLHQIRAVRLFVTAVSPGFEPAWPGFEPAWIEPCRLHNEEYL